MAKYTLTKIVKKSTNIYEVRDENGTLISQRRSGRDYVACLADGSMYFGRLDLIGKGSHGGLLSSYQERANCDEEWWERQRKDFQAALEQDLRLGARIFHFSAEEIATRKAGIAKSVNELYNRDNKAQQIEQLRKEAKAELERLNAIAYLSAIITK